MTKSEKDELIQVYKDQVTIYKEQLQDAREEIISLRKQLVHLQDGLLSIRAPQAYQDMIVDRQPPSNLPPEALERSRKINQIQNAYFRNIEAPAFLGADDMMEMLGKTIAERGVAATQPLHGNSES